MSYSELSPYELIKSDLYRYGGSASTALIIKNLLNSNRSFKYTFWFRLLKDKNLLVRWLAKFIHRHLSIKYAIQIPKEVVVGPGLYIGHGTSLIVSSTTVIGRNCNLSQFTTIGSNNGKAATIGDNCYIGPNVCLVENIVIGDGSTIGAAAVVVKDVPSGSTVVGNPARVISNENAGRYINHPVDLKCQ